MKDVHVSVASNIDPARHIPSGLVRLDAVASVLRTSPFYVTPALQRPEQPDYWNGVALVRTDLTPRALRDALRAVEAAEGRVRGEDKWAARELDLDLLLYGDRVIADDDLCVPDPDLNDRPWLVHGVLDVTPNVRLPNGQTLARPDVAFDVAHAAWR